jgi:hypothetical protein
LCGVLGRFASMCSVIPGSILLPCTWKMMYFVLLTLRDILLAMNQCESLVSSF